MQIQFSDNIYLLINIVMYLFMFLYTKKYYGNTIYTFIWLVYLIEAFLSFYIWNSGIYYNSSGLYIKNNVELLPFIIIFICAYLLIYPLKNMRITSTSEITINGRILRYIDNIGICVAFIYSCMLLPYLSIAMTSNAADIYNAERTGEGIVPHFVGVIGMIYNIAYPVLNLSFFYLLTKSKINILYVLILFVSILIPNILSSICYASRGSIFFNFFHMVIGYILFKNCISSRIKHIIYIVLISIVSFLITIVMGISLARSGRLDAVNEIIRYFGESFLNFNVVFYDNLKQPIGGERIFPYIIKQFKNIPLFDSTAESVAYYSWISGTPVALFKMIYGDFYVEFGLIGMFITIIIFHLLGGFIAKHKANKFSIVFFYFTYSQIVFTSIFDFTRAGTTAFKVLFFQIIIVLLIDKRKKHGKVFNRNTRI